jgi:nicotinamidase-related amidase
MKGIPVVLAILAVAAAMMPAPSALGAQTIIEEWGSVQAPPPPELKAVTVDTKSTALLLLDFAKQNCGKRPRCLASVPKVQKMAAEARARNAFVAHALFGKLTKEDLLIAALDNEPIVTSGANKFHRTDLEKILRDKAITTVIVTGTAAHGAVLNTAAAAALLGFKVILPVDGMSSTGLYEEQYTAWHLANAPGGIGPNVTLTKIDMLKF